MTTDERNEIERQDDESFERMKNNPKAIATAARLTALEKKPSEFAKLMGRPVAAWFNLDEIITSEEVAEIEAIRGELEEFVVKLFPLAKRVRWAVTLIDARLEDERLDEAFKEALGLEEIDTLALFLAYPFQPDSCSITELGIKEAVTKYDGLVPGLAAAVQEIEGESTSEDERYHAWRARKGLAPENDDKEVAQ